MDLATAVQIASTLGLGGAITMAVKSYKEYRRTKARAVQDAADARANEPEARIDLAAKTVSTTDGLIDLMEERLAAERQDRIDARNEAAAVRAERERDRQAARAELDEVRRELMERLDYALDEIHELREHVGRLETDLRDNSIPFTPLPPRRPFVPKESTA